MTKILAISLLGLALLAPARLADAKEPVEGKFFHHVYFWLNAPDSDGQRAEFLTKLRKMQAIPTIRYSAIGTPAGTPRDVVDNSWTFYWLVTFDDADGWRIYNDHPLHDQFRQEAGPLFKKVQVYDVILED